jgi:hypothetical protein
MQDIQQRREPYIAFVEYKLKALAKLNRSNVDAISYQLLEIIWAQHMSGVPLHIHQATTLNHLGSASTLYRRIQLLLHKQLIEYFRKDDSIRFKFIRPTETSIALFDDLCYGFNDLKP